MRRDDLRGVLLDTDVVSELSRKQPDAGVEAWFARRPVRDYWTTAINIGECWRGISLLPVGKRRRRLEDWFGHWLLPTFAERIVPFDHEASIAWANLAVGHAKARDFKSMALDLQIAAIAKTGGFLLATRNERDFGALDLPLVNPWRQAGATDDRMQSSHDR